MAVRLLDPNGDLVLSADRFALEYNRLLKWQEPAVWQELARWEPEAGGWTRPNTSQADAAQPFLVSEGSPLVVRFHHEDGDEDVECDQACFRYADDDLCLTGLALTLARFEPETLEWELKATGTSRVKSITFLTAQAEERTVRFRPEKRARPSLLASA